MQNIERSYIDLDTNGHRYAILVSRFNYMITQKLLKGALRGLEEHGVAEEAIQVAWVPGAFELPLIARKMAASKRYDAVICLGCVIRGETPHFEYVAGQAAAGILRTSLETNVPVIFSVLTTNSLDQAEERAGEKEKNNGYNGALTAIEMANLMKKL